MITKAAAAALALACSPAGAAFAQPAATPHRATGHVNQAPGIATIDETENQIRANTVIGTSVRTRDGKEVATIADLIVDRRQGTVDLAVLEPVGGTTFKGGQSTIAWKSLSFQPMPTPRFVTALSLQVLSSGTSFKQQVHDTSAYYDLEADLLGKKAVGPHGQALGTINTLVFDVGSGRIVALVLDTGGFLDAGAKDHAVAWNKAKPQGTNPVHLVLSKAQIDSAPVITLSGTSIPEPATNR
jgi:sporulation protein YlmC with PRC-barrel domain